MQSSVIAAVRDPGPGTSQGRADFAGCSLLGSGLQRRSEVPADCRPDGYAGRFDADTFWIDAVHAGPQVILVCPRLTTLLPALRSARFHLDGLPVSARFRTFKRHTLITLPATGQPERVAVEIGGWRGESAVHPAEPDIFCGRNVIVTLSRDNDLAWIHDFARFHAHHHGADAMLFFDNGSHAYGPREIADTLRRAGIDRVRVLRTSLTYGPRGKRPYLHCDQYLQTCLLNIARLRFLSRARAVLNCDVDELVHARGASVFDLAARSALGFLRFEGHWRYPAPGTPGAARHAAHSYARRDGKPCSAKWCIVPGGPLGRFQWRPHSLETLPLARLFKTRDAAFWHCRAVTDDWKGYGRLATRSDTGFDAEITAAMQAAGLV